MSNDLKVICIVDYKKNFNRMMNEYKEMQRMLTERGYECFIASPEEISNKENSLYISSSKIDVIYNRLILDDPRLLAPEHKHIRDALIKNKVRIIVMSSDFQFETKFKFRKLQIFQAFLCFRFLRRANVGFTYLFFSSLVFGGVGRILQPLDFKTELLGLPSTLVVKN